MFSRTLRRILGPAFAAAALATAACGGGSDATAPSDPPGDAVGNYQLTALRCTGNLGGGGPGLPVSFIDGSGDQLTFIAGTLQLADDGSYSLTVSATYNGGAVTMTDEGSFTRHGSSLSFSSTTTHQRMFSGNVTGNQVTADSQFGGIHFDIDLQK
jgi:hypothetical protein